MSSSRLWGGGGGVLAGASAAAASTCLVSRIIEVLKVGGVPRGVFQIWTQDQAPRPSISIHAQIQGPVLEPYLFFTHSP